MANIGVLVGSLSKYSYSQKLANYLIGQSSKANFIQINYDILPLYNPDLEKEPPLEWQVFREVVDKMDALLFVIQEYNFSIPGGLKNAIDILSVPSPQPHIYHKPALVITDSSGAPASTDRPSVFDHTGNGVQPNRQLRPSDFINVSTQ